jgi:hypothetical protein
MRAIELFGTEVAAIIQSETAPRTAAAVELFESGGHEPLRNSEYNAR